MKRASIDIGSNSILLLAADITTMEILLNESNVTGLGRDLDKNGEFIPDAMEESYAILEEYTKKCSAIGISPTEIIVTATEASRVAKNAGSFFEKVKDKLGLSITIISGEGEAFYSAQGILFDKNIEASEIVIMDIGGASTELIKVDAVQKKVLSSFSMPVGAVRLTNWRADSVMEKKFSDVLKNYDSDMADVKTKTLYCVAGTMTSVGNMFLGNKTFEENEVNGLQMSSQKVAELLEKNSSSSPEDFLENFPFLGKRSKTILSGLILANRLLSVLGVEKVIISTYGLRYGTLLSGQIEENYVWRKF